MALAFEVCVQTPAGGDNTHSLRRYEGGVRQGLEE